MSDPEGGHSLRALFDPRVRNLFSERPWASQRPPTAIDLNPFGIRKHIVSDFKLKLTHYPLPFQLTSSRDLSRSGRS